MPVLVPQVPQCAPVMQLWLVSRSPAARYERPQYAMALLSLAGFPALKPPARFFPEATHEVAVLPLEPADGPCAPRTLARSVAGGYLRWIRALEVRCQVAALHTDAASLMQPLAGAIVQLGWNPDIIEDPAGMRASWQAAVTRNLDRLARERARSSGAQATMPEGAFPPPPQ